MLIQAGFKISFECPAPTPMLLQLNIHPSRSGDLRSPDVIKASRPADEAFLRLVGDVDPLVSALAISALAVNPARGRGLVDDFWPDKRATSPFLTLLRGEAAQGLRCEAVAAMADLLNIDAFADLDLATLAEVASQSEWRRYSVGELICRAGDPSDFMFVLVEGETQTWLARGAEKLVLGGGRKGSVFGELGLITQRPRAATVEVSQGPATALVIPRAIVDDLLNRDLHATRGLLGVVSRYLLDTITATARPLAPSVAAD